MADGVVYCFDAFELDSSRRVLLHGGNPVDLPDRCIAILLLLVTRANEAVHKDDVQRAGWNDQPIADESISQAIFAIRAALGGARRARYIHTERNFGYRFVGEVVCRNREPERADATVDVIVSPYRILSQAHVAVGTMSLSELQRARELIRSVLHATPASAQANIDMATACLLTFEASRMEITPDFAALGEALQYARAACDSDPKLGAAWSTLAFAQDLSGDRDAAIASAGLAVTLDPSDAWHQVRLGFATFGTNRRRAAERLKEQCPHYAGAYWLDGSVMLARQAFLPAIEILARGCALQDAQQRGGAFNAVGLHLMRGNALNAIDRDDEAIEAYRRELGVADPEHLYMRECCANSAYSIAAVHWRNGRIAQAETSCREALTFVPRHPLTLMLLAALTNQPAPDPAFCAMYAVDPILTKVAALSLCDRHEDAATLAAQLLMAAPPGADGWLLAAEPLIHARGHLAAWAQPLRLLHDRAS